MPTKIHVFGDTGGHAVALFRALAEIGVDLESWTIPEGVAIVHLGDLIHKGPSSNVLVEKINGLLERNPGQWLQVLGNHELQHVEDGIAFWRCSCSPETELILEDWYESGKARLAWALEDVLPQKWTNGNRPLEQEQLITSFLASHGGLTYPIWKALGSPLTPCQAADRIQADRQWWASSAGLMMGGNVYGQVGPVWAMAGSEVYPYWEMAHRLEGVAMPFGQLLGHNAAYDYDQNRWWPSMPQSFRKGSKVLLAERRTVGFVANSAMICMDPGYEKATPQGSQPYLTFEIEGELPSWS